MAIANIPILRRGAIYDSLEKVELTDVRSGATVARVSQANAGLIRRDVRRLDAARAALRRLSAAELCDICRRAGELFMKAALPVGEGESQTPQQYIEALSATSGLPYVLCGRNMAKINTVLTEMATILGGLTRGLDLAAIDIGHAQHHGIPVSFYPTTQTLGIVLPSNSPGVNSIWLPTVALKIPVVVKPGREEPWTPYRVIQALITAGCPSEAFSFYPTDHEGADTIMATSARAIIFGDDATCARFANDPTVQAHGTGRSKILVGPDMIDRWPEWMDVLFHSVVDNGGRSCINASCIMVPAHANLIADALAKKLAQVKTRSPEDEGALLAGFANPKFAQFIDDAIEHGLAADGAEDVTARYRVGPRKVRCDGCDYLLPTVVRCSNFEHPLANTEFLFPFCSVLELPADQFLGKIGPSLVVTAITDDAQMIDQLMCCPLIDRLNVGPIPTSHVEWSQPHEGNLFDFLYNRRAIQLHRESCGAGEWASR